MANYTVSTLDDEQFNSGDLAAETADGNGLSLREALALTSSNGVSDAIGFAPGLSGGTLFLTNGTALEIITTNAISIDGDINHDGTPDITISADSALGADDATSRVITIPDIAGVATTTLNGLIIRDGEADNGGGILTEQGLVLTNSSVLDNHATQNGGGIYGDGTLTNVTVSDNQAAGYGGGIWFGEFLALSASTVSDNTAGGHGGGIYGSRAGPIGSIAELTNSTVADNHAGGGGGGLVARNVRAFNTTISGNRADGDPGGGIYGFFITLTNTTVSGNSTGSAGGGVYGYEFGITVSNSTVTGNWAASRAGGITLSGPARLANSIVAGNETAGVARDLSGFGNVLSFDGGNVIGSLPVDFTSISGAATVVIDGADRAALETVFDAVAPNPDTGVLSGVLADNGGPVATVALRLAGVAHDAGAADAIPRDTRDLDGDANTTEPLPVDARGHARVMGTAVDLGAYEHDLVRLGDVVWRNDDGAVAATHNLASAPHTWAIEGTADFDGDGDGDILWRHVDGDVVTWELEDGRFVTNHSIAFAAAGWDIRGVGDFDGDGDGDIVWHHADGAVVTWEMENGQYVQNHNIAFASSGWRIDGTGDFDDDGDTDILWRHDEGAVVTWEMEEGQYVINHNLASAGNSWRVAGTGDFDRDGDADILWRHDEGAVVTWEMQGGDLVTNHGLPGAGLSWQIEGIEDFDSDGDADILWRHDEGEVVVWDMEDGNFLQNRNLGISANAWQVAGTGEFDLV